jgi:hypothetical protein
MAYLLTTPTLKTIILHATWGTHISNQDAISWIGTRLVDDFYSYPSDKSPEMPDKARKAAISAKLSHAITKLRMAGKTVILAQGVPAPGFRPTKYFGRKAWYGEALDQNIGFPQTLSDDSPMNAHAFLREAANKAGAIVFDPQSLFCQGGVCYVIKNAEPLYSDETHLSLPGLALVVPPLADLVLSVTTPLPQ